MKAVITRGFDDATVEDVDKPTPGSNEVLVAVDRVQLSITECVLFSGVETLGHETIRRRIEDGDDRIFGHEFCGTVVEVGTNVDEFEVGDHVYAPGKVTCGDCPYCRAGHRDLCKNPETPGIERTGALAEYFAEVTEPLSKLPDGVSDAEGAAMQPMADALLTVHEADIQTGDVIAILGSGIMGYQLGQLALQHGADEVYAVDIDPKKVQLARERGLRGIDAREEDPIERVLEATDGIGADVVFEAVGGEQAHATEGTDPLAQAYETVRKAGTIVQVGMISSEITFDPRAMRGKCVRWVNPRTRIYSPGPNGDMGEAAARLVTDGRVSIDEFVTHEFDGLESFDRAVEVTLHKDEHDALGPAQLVL